MPDSCSTSVEVDAVNVLSSPSSVMSPDYLSAPCKWNAIEDRFRGLLEAAPDAMVIVDGTGEIVLINAQTERLFGYPRAELLGQPVELLVPERFREHHDEHREGYAADPHTRSMGAGLELYGRCKDGTEFPVEISLAPLETEDGTLVSSAIRDITDRKRAEDRFRGLLESAPDAMVIVDGTGQIVLINAQTEKLFGYPRTELLGQRVELLVPDRFREHHDEHREGYAEDPHTRSMGAGLELYGRRKDGSEFPVEISLAPLETEEGTLVSSAIRDITDRKRAEDQFRGLLEAAPDAMVIVDGTGEIVLINAQTERLFGYPRAELLGQPVELLVPERFREHHDEHREGYAADPHTRSMGAGLELYGRCKDGTEFPVEISLAPLETEDGTLVSSAIRDITDRKRAEHDASHLAAVVESSHDAIIGKDLHGIVTSWNRGAELLYGYKEQEMRGRSISELLVPGADDDLADILRRIRSGDRIEEHEAVRSRKDGTHVEVSLTISPILGPNGTVVGASTIARDISDRRKTEQMKDEFLALVSHELRTPLSSIVAYTELLLDDDLSSEQRSRFVEVIDRNSVRLQRLVGDLLFVAQLESANLSLSMTELDIVAIAREAVEAANPSAQQSGVEVVLEAPDGPVALIGDPGRLGQAIDNLISNAIKYSPDGGAVTVRILPVDGECIVEVEDHGIGIAATDQQHLFKRFFRASSALDLHIQGVGLGLMIVKTIVEGHGGMVSMSSTPGAGTKFRIVLPLQQPSESRSPTTNPHIPREIV